MSTTSFGLKFSSITDSDCPKYSVDVLRILLRLSRPKISGNILSALFWKNLKTTLLLRDLRGIFSKSQNRSLKRGRSKLLMMMGKNLLLSLSPTFLKLSGKIQLFL